MDAKKTILGISIVLLVSLLSIHAGLSFYEKSKVLNNIIIEKNPNNIYVPTEKDVLMIGYIGCSSHSMFPKFLCGDTITKVKYVGQELKVGYVISYCVDKNDKECISTIFHRIIEIDTITKKVLTKGDNNTYEDKFWLEREQIKWIILEDINNEK